MTGNEVLLDTNAYIAWYDENPRILDKLRFYEFKFLSLFTIAELKFGVHNSDHPTENRELLEKQFRFFESLLPNLETTEFYAEIKLGLKRKGRPIPSNDLWIASLAIQHDLPLLANDRHFDDIDGLTVVGW